jgi:hypothetical protein
MTFSAKPVKGDARMTSAPQTRPLKQRVKGIFRKIFGKKPVHLLHIGKTGGTAVRSALKDHLNAGRYRIVLHGHNTTFRDIPVCERTVFFLRDPLKRFVSGFYSRQRQGQPRYFSAWNENEKSAFEYFQTPDQLACSLSSSDEDEKSRALEAMNSIIHVNTSYWDWFVNKEYCKSRIGDMFFVGFQERLNQDFETLKGRLALPNHVNLPTDDKKSHKNPSSLDTTLSDEAIRNLKAWYSGDYEFIDFCNTEILGKESSRTWERLKSMLNLLTRK